MSRYVALVLQALVAVALAPALTGFIRWLKARLQGRRGAPPWQPYFEIRKLFGKEAVVSHTASWIFTATPFVVFSTAVTVASLVPLVVVPSDPFVAGDLFAAVYLLLLGTFFLALAGLDTGSPFGGMGASREMTVVALTEPTVALSIVALALKSEKYQPKVTGHHPEKLARLAELGLDTAEESSVRDKFEVVIDCSGSGSGFRRAVELARPRGKIILKSTAAAAAEINLAPIVVNEITAIGSRCGRFQPALDALAAGKIDPRPLIDGIFPLDDGLAGFEAAKNPLNFKILRRAP